MKTSYKVLTLFIAMSIFVSCDLDDQKKEDQNAEDIENGTDYTYSGPSAFLEWNFNQNSDEVLNSVTGGFDLEYDGNDNGYAVADGLDGLSADLNAAASEALFKVGKTAHSEADIGLGDLGDAFSIETLVMSRRDNYSNGYMCLVDYKDDTSGSGFRLSLDTDNTAGLHAEFRLYTDTLVDNEYYQSLKSYDEIETDKWYHILFTFDGTSSMKIYVNGELSGTNSITGNYVANERADGSDDVYVMGTSSADTYLDGRIDNVAVFNSALSDIEALSRAASFIGGKTLTVDSVPDSNTGTEPDAHSTMVIESLMAKPGDSSVYLTWSNPSEDDYGKVIITYEENGEEIIVETNGTSKTITGLTNDTEYQFYLSAYNENIDENSESLEVSIVCTPVIGETIINENITVTSLDGFDDIVGNLAPGQTIIFTDGVYSGEFTSIGNVHGTEDHPIIIRAETVGGVSISLENTISIKKSSYVVLQGFNFTSEGYTMMKIENCEEVSILGCVFDEQGKTEGAKTLIVNSSSGISRGIELGYNTFKDKDGQGGFITMTFDEVFGISKNIHIHHNYFLDMRPEIIAGVYEGDSDREAICFGDGDSADIDTNNLVEYNLFEDCDGENEIITVKTSSNILRYNTFKNCFGDLSLRYGDNHEVYGNVFYGVDTDSNEWETSANFETGGIRLYGTNQYIYNNYFYNLTGETSTHRMPIVVDGGGSGGHYSVKNSYIGFNTIVDCYYGLGLGMNYSSAPTDNTIEYNVVSNSTSKSVIVESGSNTNSWTGNIIDTSGAIDDSVSGRTIATTTDLALSYVEGIYKTTNTTITEAINASTYGITGNLKLLEITDVGPDQL